MTDLAPVGGNVFQLLLPAVLLVGLMALLGSQVGLLHTSPTTALAPDVVTIEARSFSYRAPGEFQRLGSPVNGPLLFVPAAGTLDIMRYQVTVEQYDRCVEANACEPAQNRAAAMDWPVTGVSFTDAVAYAAWLSAATGERWRLPTAEEWAFAAGSKAVDHALKVQTDPTNPADRWIAAYEQEAAAATDSPASAGPAGSFGVNELGVADLAANVWEWTSTCYSRTSLGGSGEAISAIESCGVRYLEGRHRTPMTQFVRDARGGGCSLGVPPDNLGIRLVRDRPLFAALMEWVLARL